MFIVFILELQTLRNFDKNNHCQVKDRGKIQWIDWR